MATTEQKTYLELSEEGGGAHKFYEVTVKGSKVTVRYGRIGDEGASQETKCASPAEAKAFADKKVKEKSAKGYAPAVAGGRAKRAVVRRGDYVSKASTVKHKAPVLWRFKTKGRAYGIFVDEALCWMGNQEGQVYALDRAGAVAAMYKFPQGVECIIADGPWRYAGCDDGNVYDLTGAIPRLAYTVSAGTDLLWMDIHGGTLVVSDNDGYVTALDHEGEALWRKKSKGDTGWMVRCDDAGVYHGHSEGVTAYDWKGKARWSKDVGGSVLFGWQDDDRVYAATSDDTVVELAKKDGKLRMTYRCDGGVPSCAASPGGKYVFAEDGAENIYCFDAKGERRWKLATGCGPALSMQYLDGRLYVVTGDGSFAEIDAGEAAIAAAQKGALPSARSIAAPAVKESRTTALETTTDRKGGVVVECFKDGGKLRVRVTSPGYDKKRHCQFPRDIREEGAKFVVDEVRESGDGGFYRAFGNIRRLA
ncbi:MAG: WGR domain-containing protein [Polyangiales bacterium]